MNIYQRIQVIFLFCSYPSISIANSSDGWGWIVISLPLIIVVMGGIVVITKANDGFLPIFIVSLIISVSLVLVVAEFIGEIFGISTEMVGYILLSVLVLVTVILGRKDKKIE